eukprot:27144_1
MLACQKYIANLLKSLGRHPEACSFDGGRFVVRRTDGAQVEMTVSASARKLYEFIGMSRWREALKLCRFLDEKLIWSILTGMALQFNELEVAEEGLAALEEVDKLLFIQSVRQLPLPEARTAEMTLYRQQPREAEQILLQAGLIYRAIRMNLGLFQWHRALDLALKHKTNPDLVLAYRQRYLQETGKEETDERFLQCKDVEVDWNVIELKKKQEIEKEYEKAGKEMPDESEFGAKKYFLGDHAPNESGENGGYNPAPMSYGQQVIAAQDEPGEQHPDISSEELLSL